MIIMLFFLEIKLFFIGELIKLTFFSEFINSVHVLILFTSTPFSENCVNEFSNLPSDSKVIHTL